MRVFRWFLRLFVGILIGFLFSVVTIWLFQMNNPHVEVPNLLNESVTKAREILESRGLGIQVVGSGERIVSQYPLPGHLARKGRRVYVHLGQRERPEVPNVTFLQFEDAARILMALGFEVDPTFIWSGYESGIVVGTYTQGKLVKMLVSKGKRWVGPAPNMRFLPLRLAEELCCELGIDYNVEKTESVYPSGVVVGQKTVEDFPKARVNLVVDDGASFTFFVYTYFRKLPFWERLHTLALPVIDTDSERLIALIRPGRDGLAIFGWMSLKPLQLEVIRWRDGSGGLYASTPIR
ncbi:MAG: PASTA domain-containing protein [Thermotogae bacterium]|nr:PASTA domain-containing protein [Thermotogota bacterium]